MAKNVTACWTFKDGREYVISLSINEHAAVGPNFALKITDKITAEEWSFNCDAKCIENLTLKTGSYKPFNVFVTMITSALLKKSDSVLLDLMSFEDLEKLRSQKMSSPGSGSSTGFGGPADLSNSPMQFTNCQTSSILGEHNKSNHELGSGRGSGTSFKKKYLIVTYVAEFDRVHYPIQLQQISGPDPSVMQSSILQLRSEVVSLRNCKSTLEEEVQRLKEHGGLTESQIQQQMQYHLHQHHGHSGRDRGRNRTRSSLLMMRGDCAEENPQELIRNEALRAQILENQDMIGQLRTENEKLRVKLEASEKYETELEQVIYRLTRGQGRKGVPHHRSSSRNKNDHEGHSKGGDEEDYGEAPTTWRETRRTFERAIAYSPIRVPRRSSENNIENSNDIQITRRSRSFSPSPARQSKFDPTAYIQQKKMRQEQIAQMRLAKIRAKLRPRHSSASSMDEGSVSGRQPAQVRTRSSSRESKKGGENKSKGRNHSGTSTPRGRPTAKEERHYSHFRTTTMDRLSRPKVKGYMNIPTLPLEEEGRGSSKKKVPRSSRVMSNSLPVPTSEDVLTLSARISKLLKEQLTTPSSRRLNKRYFEDEMKNNSIKTGEVGGDDDILM